MQLLLNRIAYPSYMDYQSLDKYRIEGIVPDGLINKAANLLETASLRSFSLKTYINKCSYAQIKLRAFLYRVASALRPSGMTNIPLFYVVRPNITDYANMLIPPSGTMPYKLNFKQYQRKSYLLLIFSV